MQKSQEFLLRDTVMKELDKFSKIYPYVVSPKSMIERIPKYYIDGSTSDGNHTFDELYHHRAVLFSIICNTFPYSIHAWKSKKHHDGDMYADMFIVGIDTPKGQATYHYDIYPYWDLFKVKELEFAPEWDGHTSEEAIERMYSVLELSENMHFRDKKRDSENL